MNNKVLIIIPVYNECTTIEKIINQISCIDSNYHILIINDNSNDGTKEIIEKNNFKNLVYLERPKKLGLGTAHKLSIFYAIKFVNVFLMNL